MTAKNRMEVVQADITKLKVDAVVNAANTSLLGGGGVDGAIHRAAGPELLKECETLGGCKTGEAKITEGFKLPAKFVIHAVGPVWSGGKRKEADLLASCYKISMDLAVKHGVKTIAFPAISCGVYRFPVQEAAGIAVGEVKRFLEADASITKVVFACFGDDITRAYQNALKREWGQVPTFDIDQ